VRRYAIEIGARARKPRSGLLSGGNVTVARVKKHLER